MADFNILIFGARRAGKSSILASMINSFEKVNLTSENKIKLEATKDTGKYKGRSVEEVFQLEPSYYSWMMQGDFPLNTKNVITEIYTRARRRF